MGTTSFFAALSGLSANRQAIDVIGNNLANLNTIAFKKSTTSFADVFSASLATSVNGAGNPLEVGLGVRVSAIDQVFSQGSLRSTGSATDMGIQGAGFFLLQGSDGSQSYSRAGKFNFNKDGDLVAPNGKFVLGFPATETGEILTGATPAAINVSAQTNSQPNATTNIFMSTLLDADATADSASGEFSSPLRVFDSLGVAHTLNFVFRRVDPTVTPPPAGIALQWAFDVRIDASEVLDAGGTPAGATGESFSILNGALVPADPSIAGGDFTGTLDFDPNGVLQSVNIPGVGTFANGATPVDPNGIDIPDVSGTGFTFTSGGNNLDLTWDVYNDDGSSNIVSYASDGGSGTSSVNQDGFGVGVLNSVVIDTDGTITGLFTNGDVRNLAQVALANFNNPQGLLASGDNEFAQTPGSGLPSIGTPESGGRGSISGSTLELSNVDLAEEFTNLIITERGFQANSRVITTNDQLLQEAINLSR